MNSTTNMTVIGIAVDYLIPLQNYIYQYVLLIIFITGIFSNIANLFVFMQHNLRSNACSWYFMTVSMGHLIFLFFGCLPRILTAWSGFDLTRTSLGFCKVRVYFLACGLLISRYFLSMISIDRWMVTSPNVRIRRQSSLHVAKWMVIIGTSFWLCFSVCMPIWYQIEGSRGCVGASNSAFPLFYAIYNLATILAPLGIMIVFSLLVLWNIRQVQHRQISTGISATTHGLHNRRKDIQLIKLAMIQAIVYILTTAFYAYNGTHAFVTQSVIKSHEQTIIEGFLTTIGINISYVYLAITFFLYTLISKIFRKEFLLACQRFKRHFFN